MTDGKPQCGRCGSLDTVGYWDIKANRGHYLQKLYPNARVCVDCENVMYREAAPCADLSKPMRMDSTAFKYRVTYKWNEGDPGDE